LSAYPELQSELRWLTSTEQKEEHEHGEGMDAA
jgi:hypothetical protein